jgi:hypothetical protein
LRTFWLISIKNITLEEIICKLFWVADSCFFWVITCPLFVPSLL